MIEIPIFHMINLRHSTGGSFYHGHGKKTPMHTIKTSCVLPMIEINMIYASNLYNKMRGSVYHGLGKTTHTLRRCHVCYPWKKFTSFIWAICIIWQGGHSTTGMVRSHTTTLPRCLSPMTEIHIIYMSKLHNKRRGSFYHGRGKKTPTLSRYQVC